jgi:uncharacterized SAM-dependent methyltransferase
MLLGMDGTYDKDVIWKSYHDEFGLFEKFIRNGMEFSNVVVGEKWFNNDDWALEGVFDDKQRCMHKFIFTAKRTVKLPAGEGYVMLPVGEKIEGYRAFKLSRADMTCRFQWAELTECNGWTSVTGRIRKFSPFPPLAGCMQSLGNVVGQRQDKLTVRNKSRPIPSEAGTRFRA